MPSLFLGKETWNVLTGRIIYALDCVREHLLLIGTPRLKKFDVDELFYVTIANMLKNNNVFNQRT